MPRFDKLPSMSRVGAGAQLVEKYEETKQPCALARIPTDGAESDQVVISTYDGNCFKHEAVPQEDYEESLQEQSDDPKNLYDAYLAFSKTAEKVEVASTPASFPFKQELKQIRNSPDMVFLGVRRQKTSTPDEKSSPQQQEVKSPVINFWETPQSQIKKSFPTQEQIYAKLKELYKKEPKDYYYIERENFSAIYIQKGEVKEESLLAMSYELAKSRISWLKLSNPQELTTEEITAASEATPNPSQLGLK